MNVYVSTAGTIAGSIPVLANTTLQIPEQYYNEQIMMRLGPGATPPNLPARILWTTFIGGAWPSPIMEM